MADIYDRVTMRWKLSGGHNAVWALLDGDGCIEVEVAYVIDSFSGLLQAAADVRLGAQNTIAVFGGEPTGSILFLSRAIDRYHLRLVSFSAMSAALARFSDGSLKWQGSASSKEFVDAVVAMADELLEEYGLEEFERRWGHPFPAQLLAKLR